MHIYSSRHSLILQDLVFRDEMTHPTERHNFTFGCYRAQKTPSIDGPEEDATTDGETDPTPVTDGGSTASTVCPACENDLANVQGVSACTHCAWTAR
jgi:hypothetical protein